jgi:hypothetical protein
MPRVVIRSFRKQLKHITHQPILKSTQKQNEQQVQPTRIKPMNAPNIDVTQRG